MTKYKVLAEAIAFNKLHAIREPKLSNKRRLTIDEIKEIIQQELTEANDKAVVKAQELENGWNDAEVENYLDWIKTLKLKEIFGK